MNQKERVEILHPIFPGYDNPLDSKCQNPERYGVTRTRAAREALLGIKKKGSETYYLSTRMSREREAQFRAAINKEPPEWLREQIDRAIEKAAREQTERQRKTTTNNISQRTEESK